VLIIDHAERDFNPRQNYYEWGSIDAQGLLTIGLGKWFNMRLCIWLIQMRDERMREINGQNERNKT